MRRREAVLEAMRSPGILGDVAADRADRLRRRIGRIEISVREYALRHMRIDHPRLDNDARVGNIDLENAIEPRQADDDSAFGRQRAAAQASPGTARHERHPMLVT